MGYIHFFGHTITVYAKLVKTFFLHPSFSTIGERLTVNLLNLIESKISYSNCKAI